MPRQARKVSPTGIYHVMMRGIDRQNIFRDYLDRLKFLHFLENSVKKKSEEDGEYEIYAYALMGNHFHLLVRVVSGKLGDLMKKVSCGYVQYFNKKYQRDGHLFKERFKSETCEDDEYFLTLLRYIHQNPIKANFCTDLMKYNHTSWPEYKTPENCSVHVCNCKYVLQHFSVSELEEIIYDILPENTKCIDTDTTRGQIPDKIIVSRIRTAHKLDPSKVKNVEFGTRREILHDLLRFGTSISQVSRITGISKSIISRIRL